MGSKGAKIRAPEPPSDRPATVLRPICHGRWYYVTCYRNPSSEGEMSQMLVYVDTAEVRPGKLEQLKAAIKELSEFVEENEPGLISYSVYFVESANRMSVVHVHADPASLDYHLDVAGPLFQEFADLVTLSSIHIYGEPSETALRQLQEKLRILGAGDVIVHHPHVGFVRAAART